MFAKLFVCLFLLVLIWVHAGLCTSPDDLTYALVMTNGAKIRTTQYSINMNLFTVTYKSASTGLTATFPLERLQKVVRSDSGHGDLPENAPVVFQNELIASTSTDDEGIPVTFKVITHTVGQSGGGFSGKTASNQKGYSNASRGSSSSGKSGQSSTSTTSLFGTPSTRAATSTRTTSTSSGSSSSSSSSGTDANSFFNALFGGDR